MKKITKFNFFFFFSLLRFVISKIAFPFSLNNLTRVQRNVNLLLINSDQQLTEEKRVEHSARRSKNASLLAKTRSISQITRQDEIVTFQTLFRVVIFSKVPVINSRLRQRALRRFMQKPFGKVIFPIIENFNINDITSNIHFPILDTRCFRFL